MRCYLQQGSTTLVQALDLFYSIECNCELMSKPRNLSKTKVSDGLFQICDVCRLIVSVPSQITGIDWQPVVMLAERHFYIYSPIVWVGQASVSNRYLAAISLFPPRLSKYLFLHLCLLKLNC